MSEHRKFFSRDDIINLMRECSFALRGFNFSTGSAIATLPPVISSMENEANGWDKYTQYSIVRYGDAFRNSLSNVAAQPDENHIEILAGLAFIFFMELELSVSHELGDELKLFREAAVREFEQRSDRVGASVKFGLRQLPISILKSMLSSESVGILKNLDTTANQLDEKIKAWDKSIDEREKKVARLQQQLESHEQGYNFVGLNEGFAKMAETISKELKGQKFYLKAFGALMLLPALIDIALIMSGKLDLANLPKFTIGAWAVLSITTTIVFLYFFRISLREVDAQNAQLMQLRLRMTLCQFIQSYAKYAKEIRKDGADILGKFENIIFSGIISNQDKLPSTFDGLEHLTALIKSAKGT